MRTSSNTVRTCRLMPHSFKSPPLALNWRRHERMAPSPELSTKRSRCRSRTNSLCASRMGAMSRLNSATLLASSSSTGTTATATSLTFSTAISMRTSRSMVLDQFDATPSTLILVVAHFIDASGNNVGAETRFPRAIKGRRGNRLGVEGVSQVMQPDGDMAGKRVAIQTNHLVGTAVIGVLHNVDGGLVNRQFEGADAIELQRRTGSLAAEHANEFTHVAQLGRI